MDEALSGVGVFLLGMVTPLPQETSLQWMDVSVHGRKASLPVIKASGMDGFLPPGFGGLSPPDWGFPMRGHLPPGDGGFSIGE